MCEFVARTKQTRSTLLQTCLCGSLWLVQNKPDLLCCRLVYVWVCGSYKPNQIYFAADLFMWEFVARTKQTRSTLLQTCLCVSLWLAENKPDLLCCRLVYVWGCGSHKTNQIYFAADLFMCEFVARTKQTRSTLLQTCLCGSLWLAQNKPDLLCCRLVYVGVCGSYKTNQIYFAADLFMCEFVARTKQTRSTLLQTCLCVSLWLVQNKPDLLCCRLVYFWVCGSHKPNKIYFAADLFMWEFVARTKQTRSTLLQTCLCVSLWLAQTKPDLFCCRLVYVWVCGSHKTNKVYFATDLFMCEFVARTKQTRSTLLQTCLCGCLWLAQNKPDLLCCRLVYVWVNGSHKTNQIYFAADLFMSEFVARTKQTRSTLLQTCLCVSLWLVQNKPDLLCYRRVNVWVCGAYKTNQIYFAADLFMCEFVARTKQTRSTLLQTCLCGSLWLAQNKPDLLCCRLVYVWVCGSHKTNKIYFAADLFMCEFVARPKQTRSILLQTCLCVSLWLVQNKPDLLCCRLVYVGVCGSYKTNQIYFAADLFMCEFVARKNQTRSTLLQTCLCVSLWLAQNKPDLLCCRLVYVGVCGSHKTNQIYFAADLFMCEFVARTKQTRSTLLQTCLCVSLWLAENKQDLLCCRLVYVWVCGSYKTNQIYFAKDLFMCEFVARTKQTRSTLL